MQVSASLQLISDGTVDLTCPKCGLTNPLIPICLWYHTTNPVYLRRRPLSASMIAKPIEKLLLNPVNTRTVLLYLIREDDSPKWNTLSDGHIPALQEAYYD